MSLGRCVVMQPFEKTYNERFDQVYLPAIEAVCLEAYRVDRDLRATKPVEDIEREIRNSFVCLADISDDNPNVYYEVGYALACGHDVVLIRADDAPTKLPFDVAHRKIILYNTGAPAGYDELRLKISVELCCRIRDGGKLPEHLQRECPVQSAILAILAASAKAGHRLGVKRELVEQCLTSSFSGREVESATETLLNLKMITVQRTPTEYGAKTAEYLALSPEGEAATECRVPSGNTRPPAGGDA